MTLARLFLLLAFSRSLAVADPLPEHDQRASVFRDLNTPRAFPAITSKEQWQERARQIREQILISAGLWPMPEKTPLQASVSGKIVRDGYSVEKVYFQAVPGFYMGGNLYRPAGQGNGPFPAILNPHGHAAEGRLADDKSFSAAARCINFARQGMVAFSYDMVGFNDTHFPFPEGFAAGPTNAYKTHRQFGTNAECLLWNINLLGLQTWDSMRALDFLESLPDVDKTRLACTGESGGGTQTYLLGAVDDRLAAQAPIVMVSHIMQGGCSCENAPGLRLEYSNVEIAAVPAPRPQLMVAASGDWTKDTLTMEGPSVQGIYKLFNRPELHRYVRFDFPHNYNQTSREAVYQWFGQCLLHHPDEAVKEQPYTKEPDNDLRVWPDGKLPADAVSQEQLIAWMIQRTQSQLAALKQKPDAYKKLMRTAWKHTLQLDLPEHGIKAEFGPSQEFDHCTGAKVALGRDGKGDRLDTVIFRSRKKTRNTLVILARPDGASAGLDTNGAPAGLAKRLVADGFSVMVLEPFQNKEKHKQVDLFYTTYNKTVMQERVQDIVTAAAFSHGGGKATRQRVVVCGGLSALLAAPAVDAVVADGDGLDVDDDKVLLQPDLFVPGIRAMGGYAGVMALAGAESVRVHNTNKSARMDDEAIVQWLRME